ncbi:hypothetical protein GCM10011608_10840 [Micromonospora sonchi]|uniref:Uncharacterized protein n=1 Tax=Micromonospora sonchi TaxID=1763543 RepID=A0A917TMR4_9ACTN|nr:hypothetical protein [Micromonospora sonchi]GGM27853.1 hypothetical protein GCM10011608_10840 [Micromonospora sonchi]
MHFDTIRVDYEGGPLHGDSNDQDYTADDLRHGLVFDYPTRGLGRGGVGADDTVERYVLERRAYGWVFVHTGRFVQPIEDQAFEAVVVGGPQHGEVIYLLGTARRWVGQRVDHVARGCVLRHVGGDPTTGWDLRFQAEVTP